MRIWSLHPQYLDSKGLVALWRETLLAKNVLEGNTKGYTHHPQLTRFKEVKNPVAAIHQYLAEVWEEAYCRGYHFDRTKINCDFSPLQIPVTSGQMNFEKEHLFKKLAIRDPEKLRTLSSLEELIPAKIFYVIEGEIEPWEII